MIRRHLDKLCSRLSQFAETGETLDFGAATTAFARDVANEFILGKSYNSLDHKDFEVAMLEASQGAGQIWRITKFVRWFAPTLRAVPIPLVMKIASGEMKIFFRHIEVVDTHW
jgi:hypothetical protein